MSEPVNVKLWLVIAGGFFTAILGMFQLWSLTKDALIAEVVVAIQQVSSEARSEDADNKLHQACWGYAYKTTVACEDKLPTYIHCKYAKLAREQIAK